MGRPDHSSADRRTGSRRRPFARWGLGAAGVALAAGGAVLGALGTDALHKRMRPQGPDVPLPAQPPAKAAAAEPTKKPRQPGWKGVVVRSARAFTADQIPAWAAGVTFFALLALFPALGAFVSLYGLIGDASQARHLIMGLSGVLPSGAVTVISTQLGHLTTIEHTSLGFAFATNLVISLWSSNAGVRALFAALNAAYEQKERRGLIVLNLVSLACALGLIVFAILAVGAIVAAPETLTLIGLGGVAKFAFLRWPLILAVVCGLLSLLYRYGPSQPHGTGRWLTVGSVVAGLGWLAMSAGFSWYVAHFGSYDRTYGALGGVIGFMTWIWLSLMVVLFGAELNAEIERHGALKRAGILGATLPKATPPS